MWKLTKGAVYYNNLINAYKCGKLIEHAKKYKIELVFPPKGFFHKEKELIEQKASVIEIDNNYKELVKKEK